MASACTIVLANDAGGAGGGGGGVVGGGMVGGGVVGGFRAVRPSSCVLMTIGVAAACVFVVAGVLVVREYALSAGYDAATSNDAEPSKLTPRPKPIFWCRDLNISELRRPLGRVRAGLGLPRRERVGGLPDGVQHVDYVGH